MKSKGYSIEEIAEILFLAPDTIRGQIKDFRKQHDLGNHETMDHMMLRVIRKLIVSE